MAATKERRCCGSSVPTTAPSSPAIEASSLDEGKRVEELLLKLEVM